MAQLKDTTINGSLNVTGQLTADGVNIVGKINQILQVINQSDYTKLEFPGGFKLYCGISSVSSTTDPAGIYSVNLVFDEPFSNADYIFLVTDYLQTAGAQKYSTCYPYYQKTKSNIYVGSIVKSCKFSWIAFGR